MGADTYLASLASIKQWLAIPDNVTTADSLLLRMDKAVSAHVINHLNRDNIALASYRDVYDGYGNAFMVMRRSPIYSIQTISFNGTPIPAATGDGITSPLSHGWSLEPEYSVLGTQRLNLYGFVFPRARGSVVIQYQAGYVTVDEPMTVPASPYQSYTLYHWLAGVTVKDASTGALLTQVPSAPITGQYAIDANGLYTFAAADVGRNLLTTYSFVPSDIEQAVIEIVGERYKYMDRIGVLSKALGGQETVSFSQKAMSEIVTENLTPYMQVTPI